MHRNHATGMQPFESHRNSQRSSEPRNDMAKKGAKLEATIRANLKGLGYGI